MPNTTRSPYKEFSDDAVENGNDKKSWKPDMKAMCSPLFIALIVLIFARRLSLVI